MPEIANNPPVGKQIIGAENPKAERSIIAGRAIEDRAKKSKVEELQRILAKVREELGGFEDKKNKDVQEDEKSDSEEENEDKNSEASFDPKSSLDSKNTKKSAAKKPQENAQIEGVRETLKNLAAKLKEVEKNKRESLGNESENVKGFSIGGSSKEVDGVDKEIGMLQGLIAESQAKLLAFQIIAQQKQLTQEDVKAAQGAVRSYIEDAKDKGMIVGGKDDEKTNEGYILSFTSSDEAMRVAENIAAQYESLGISTSISSAKVGQKKLITVTVEIPNQLAGKDPLSLNPKEILDALQGEKSLGNEQKDNEQEHEGRTASWVEKVSEKQGVQAGLGMQTGNVKGSWADYVSGRKVDGVKNFTVAK